MKLHQMGIAEVFARLNTSRNGLRENEVQERLLDFGLNEIKKSEKKNYLWEYFSQYAQFFAILLEVAAVLSFVADYYAPDEGNNILGWAIVCAVVINATFTFWQEYKADKAMEALLRLMPSYIKVVRNCKEQEIESRYIVPGDIMVLEEGDKISADAILIEANSLFVNMSTLNGESTPALRIAEPETSCERELEADNIVFAGTSVISGNGLGVVYATADGTEFGKIATLTRDVQKTLTPMQKEIMRITQILTLIAVIMGVIFFVLGYFSNKGILMAAIFALSLIVANVPEGLLPTITLSLSLASQRMARRNALVKNLDSVETLGSATVICTDKTGTLTRNEMTLKEVFLASGETVTLSGEGYFESGGFQLQQVSNHSLERLKHFMRVATLNTHAHIEHEKLFGDPTELAIIVAGKKIPHDINGFNKINEIPFTSERKMMSSFYEKENVSYLFAKGAVEIILNKCTDYLNDHGLEALSDEKKANFLAVAESYEARAFRVLAVAEGQDEKEENLTFLGFVAIMDLPRAEVYEAIQHCYEAGIRVMMITGDSPGTAKAIGQMIGLKIDKIITGDQLRRLGEEELMDELKQSDILFARMESSQKLLIASLLQSNGEVVAMTGDGVNDAPALRKADIGISMGIAGTEVTKEAADMILLDDNFSSIVSAIEEGRTVYFNIKKFVTYILSSNVPEIVPYILQFFLKIPLPLSVIQILSIDLGSDMIPGLALGSEKPEENIMKRQPVGKSERILDWEVFKRGYFMNGIFEAMAAMFGFMAFLYLHGWQYGDLSINQSLLHRQAMTMTLLGAVFCQLLNVWTLRSYEFSAFSMGFFKNKLLLIAMVIEFVWIYMLLYVEPVQRIFNTAPVPPGDLLILLPFPIMLFLTHEFYKYKKRRKSLLK